MKFDLNIVLQSIESVSLNTTVQHEFQIFICTIFKKKKHVKFSANLFWSMTKKILNETLQGLHVFCVCALLRMCVFACFHIHHLSHHQSTVPGAIIGVSQSVLCQPSVRLRAALDSRPAVNTQTPSLTNNFCWNRARTHLAQSKFQMRANL